MNRGCNNAASLRKQLAGLQQVDRLLQTGITRGSALGPGNAGWQRELAVSYSRLAYASKKAGDKSEALEAIAARPGDHGAHDEPLSGQRAVETRPCLDQPADCGAGAVTVGAKITTTIVSAPRDKSGFHASGEFTFVPC